jgi:hypothetical protein
MRTDNFSIFNKCTGMVFFPFSGYLGTCDLKCPRAPRIFNRFLFCLDSHLFDIVEPRHPCTGALTLEDIQRRLTQYVKILMIYPLSCIPEIAQFLFSLPPPSLFLFSLFVRG